MTYEETIESVRARYDARARELLGAVARACEHYGHRATRDEAGSVVTSWGDDQYVWQITVEHADDPELTFGVELTLVEERAHEGGAGWGVSFEVLGSLSDGKILFQVAPWNYTERWVVDARDEEAVEARWEELEGAVVAGEIAERFEESSRGVDP